MKKWTQEQRALRELFVERHVHGMGGEVARELGVAPVAVYSFKRGEKPFPEEKLASLRDFLAPRSPRPAPPVREKRPVLPGPTDQEAVRALLVKRHVYGMGLEIGKELGIAPHALHSFKRGRRRFSKEKLAALRAFLMRERSDPQIPVRELLLECLLSGHVSGSEVARRFGLNRSTVSRFKDGELSFPAERLEELAAYLRARSPKSASGARIALRSEGRSPSPALMAPLGKKRAAPRDVGAFSPPLRTVLADLAIRFASGLIRAALSEPLAELRSIVDEFPR
jgi:transcriptional regulator with XRE-family HTH domain